MTSDVYREEIERERWPDEQSSPSDETRERIDWDAKVIGPDLIYDEYGRLTIVEYKEGGEV